MCGFFNMGMGQDKAPPGIEPQVLVPCFHCPGQAILGLPSFRQPQPYASLLPVLVGYSPPADAAMPCPDTLHFVSRRSLKDTCCNHLKHGAFSTKINHLKHAAFSAKIKGHHHLQGNVQVYNVRISVVSRGFALGKASGRVARLPPFWFR